MVLSECLFLLEPSLQGDKGAKSNQGKNCKAAGDCPSMAGLSLLPEHLLEPACQAGHQRPCPVRAGQGNAFTCS